MRHELSRKAIHVVTNALIPLAYLILNVPRFWMALILGISTIIIVLIDVLRIQHSSISRLFTKLFGRMLRTHEINGKLTGASYVLIGSFVAVVLFPKEIAILALLFTAIGDTVAGLYGRKFGKFKIWTKTIEGSLAGLIACIIIAVFFTSIPNLVKYSGAFAAMLIELLPINIDDNLRIPVFSGAIMYFLLTIL